MTGRCIYCKKATISLKNRSWPAKISDTKTHCTWYADGWRTRKKITKRIIWPGHIIIAFNRPRLKNKKCTREDKKIFGRNVLIQADYTSKTRDKYWFWRSSSTENFSKLCIRDYRDRTPTSALAVLSSVASALDFTLTGKKRNEVTYLELSLKFFSPHHVTNSLELYHEFSP